MSIINDYGWQISSTAQQRPVNSATDNTLAYTPISLQTSAAASSSTARNNTQDQRQDNQNEAFAKFKVNLQNPDQANATQKSALEEFREYMALSPEEKIREKMLRELGLSQDDYEALPPEKKDLIDKQIAQRMKEEMEVKTIAKLQPQEPAVITAQALAGAQATGQGKGQEDPLG